MNLKKNKKLLEGFNLNHFLLIFVSAVMLVGFLFLRGDLHLSAFSLYSSSAENSSPLTYEQVKAEVEKANQAEEVDPLTKEVIAMLDPANAGGSVLGVSTEDLIQFPKAEDLVASEQLRQMPVKIISESGKEAVEKYFGWLTVVETKYNILDLLASLNSTDDAVLKNAKTRSEEVVKVLSGLSVPEELVDFHRFKYLYFLTLGKVALALTADAKPENLLGQTQILFSLTDKLERMKQDFNQKYNLQK